MKEGARVSKEYITVKERQRDATWLALNVEKGSHEPRNEGSLYGWKMFSVQYWDTTEKGLPLPLPSRSSYSDGIDKRATQTGCNSSNEEKPEAGGQRV